MSDQPEANSPERHDPAAQPDEEEQDFRLAAPEGMSEAERLLRARVYPPVTEAAPTGSRFQFNLASLLTITFFVALGFAGRSWMPPAVFAGLLGLLTLAALVCVIVRPPGTAATRLLWLGLIVAYVSAIVSAFIRQNR